ncbi:MAG: hypothetical protein R3315_07095 [Woeseiaceae bacterium]|nr:hypothetical protein [Woeseiaceae bacterium]
MRCAFLTMEETAGWSIDADLAFPALERLGWTPEWLRWREPSVDWKSFDAAYLAATWDYPEDPDLFLATLESIEHAGTVLVNSLDLVRWNLPKTYLRELEASGVRIVPSRWFERFPDCDLALEFERFSAERLIVKPVISTNALNTFLLDRNSARQRSPALGAAFRERPFVVQPFMPAVQSEGEFSLFRIGEGFSHGILKRPKSGDFRVQEEYGAALRAVPVSGELEEAGQKALDALPSRPLYARVDLVRDDAGRLCLMELELIEPSLYLRMDDDAPERFARAFDHHVRGRGRTAE